MLLYKNDKLHFLTFLERLVNCMQGAGVSSMELKPFARNWTINRWDGRCVSAPPVCLWAPTVPFGNQWPPCTGWCPGSSLIHWWGRGGLGFACPLESGGCWFSAQPAAHAASTDGCRNASPWNAQTPQSEVGREGLTRSKVFNNNVSCGLTSVSEIQVCDSFTNLWWVHDDCGDKIEEDMVTVSPYSCVVESHF